MTKLDELSNPDSCLSKAMDNEMTFILLARDASAPAAILAWVADRVAWGRNKLSDPQIVSAMECAARMERQRESGELMR